MGSLSPDSRIFKGTSYVTGSARGTLIASTVELSMWGGVNPETGQVIDRHHPLCGQSLENKILAIPGGRGSCSGSGVTLELLLNGKGPKALLFERREEIITLGVMIAEEMFQKSIPVFTMSSEDFRQIIKCQGEELVIAGGCVYTNLDHAAPVGVQGNISSESTSPKDVRLSDLDREFLNGFHGEAGRVAMRIVLRMASLLGAQELMDIFQVHVDGCFYTGPGSLAFAEKLRAFGGQVRVPTTMNSILIDQKRWRALGIDPILGEASEKLANAYCDMGVRSTFTCAPYQLDSAPKAGSQVAWAESNAVVYANSVLGAKTMKYPDFLDIAIALTGRAPKAGAHIERNRLASLWVNIPKTPDNLDDSFYPLLGYHVGNLAVNDIPVVTGLELLSPSRDNLKAFGAAFATVSSAPMFHIVAVTPEAPTLEATCPSDEFSRCINLDWRDIERICVQFNSASSGQSVDLVSLGNPHFSFLEIKKLAEICQGRTKHVDVAVIVTCGRSIHGLATQAGFVKELEAFGVQFLVDTCWCMIREPVIPRGSQTIMTNSGKYAHYGPGLTGRKFCFGSLAMCVDVACRGLYDAYVPQWLQEAVESQPNEAV